MIQSHKRELKIALLAVALAAIFWYSAALQNAFFESTSFIERLIGENQFLGKTVFICLSALSAMLSPFSSVPIVPSAVAIWGAFPTFLLLLSGWVLGGVVAYSIGRYAVKAVINHPKLFGRIDEYRKSIPAKKEFFILMMFRIVLPAEIPSYALGIIKYSFWRYLVITFVAELPFALVTVYASDALINLQPLRFAVLVVVGAVLLGLMAWVLFRKGSGRRSI